MENAYSDAQWRDQKSTSCRSTGKCSDDDTHYTYSDAQSSTTEDDTRLDVYNDA